MTSESVIAGLRLQFIADNKMWCERLGYVPTDWQVMATKKGKSLEIIAFVDDYFSHRVAMPAKGMHPDMRKQIADSFRSAIGASEPNGLLWRSA